MSVVIIELLIIDFNFLEHVYSITAWYNGNLCFLRRDISLFGIPEIQQLQLMKKPFFFKKICTTLAEYRKFLEKESY